MCSHVPILSSRLIVLITVALFGAEAGPTFGQQIGSELLAERLRTRIEYAGGQTRINVGYRLCFNESKSDRHGN